jgi:hypothetical protein
MGYHSGRRNPIAKIWLIIFCHVPSISVQIGIIRISQQIFETRMPNFLKGIRY